MDTAGHMQLAANQEMAPGLSDFGVPPVGEPDRDTSMQQEFGNINAEQAMGMDMMNEPDSVTDQKVLMSAWYITHKNTMCKTEVVPPQLQPTGYNPVPWYNRYPRGYPPEGNTTYPSQFVSVDNRQANMGL